MSTSDKLALAALVVAILVPLGSLMIYFNERAKRSRDALLAKLEHMDHCLHRLHEQNLQRFAAIEQRVARIEGR